MRVKSLRKPVLAAFGGMIMLTGAAMTATAFTGPDFQVSLSGSKQIGADLAQEIQSKSGAFFVMDPPGEGSDGADPRKPGPAA